MSQIPVSVFLITKNEADRLGRSLEAVAGFADEIIVVDSGSDDRTCEIAGSFGAKVIQNVPFPGYGEQKRFAEKQCRNDWVLNIDADEVVSDQLKDQIVRLFSDGAPVADGYRVKIIEMLPGEVKPALFAYSLDPVRLYRRSRGTYNNSTVHDRVDMVNGALINSLNGKMLHYSIRSIEEFIRKLNNYSSMQAQNLVDRNIKISNFRIIFEFKIAFLKAYFGRRYFLRGIFGYLIAINYAHYRTMRLGKYFEKSKMLDNHSLKIS